MVFETDYDDELEDVDEYEDCKSDYEVVEPDDDDYDCGGVGYGKQMADVGKDLLLRLFPDLLVRFLRPNLRKLSKL